MRVNRVFQGKETLQRAWDNRKASPELWYWEPADYDGDVLWSEGYATKIEAAEASARDDTQ